MTSASLAHVARRRQRVEKAAIQSSTPEPAGPAQRLGNGYVQMLMQARLARAPKTMQRNPKAKGSTFDGVVIGVNRNGDKVTVKRDILPGQTFDDRLQAAAVARLAKAEHAVAVKTKETKGEQWHSLETDADFEAGKISDDPKATEHANKSAGILELYGIPPLSAVGDASKRFDDAKKKRSEVDQRKSGSGVDEEILKASRDVTLAQQARAAALLGVPVADINLVGAVSSRRPGFVNIIGSPDKDSPGGGHAPMGGGIDFDEGLASAYWIDITELDKPRAAETLFHEVQHIKDWELAQTWIANYRRETGRLWVKSHMKPYAEWLDAQVKAKRLTPGERELVLMEASDSTADTEAHANVLSFLLDLQLGNAELAKKAIVGYAHALKPKSQGGGGQYANPASRSAMVTALVAQLQSAYQQMPKPMREHYDDSVAAAVAEYPDAWISRLDFSKKGKK